MLICQAKDLARRWVLEEASRIPGLTGACFSGSVNWLPDDTELPATSDVDVHLIVAEPPDAKIGKFAYRGAVLDVSFLPADLLRDPEQILGSYPLAGNFRRPNVIVDLTGELSAAQDVVSARFAHRDRVRARCAQVHDKITAWAGGFDPAAPLSRQVLDWAFPTGVTTHLLLVAGLRNPTVRRRYAAVRELLAVHDRLDFHETLLARLGCAHLSAEAVTGHLDRFADAFDAAGRVQATPTPFATDIGEAARPIVIGGSAELIEAGLHREAVFWMVGTWAKCHQVLAADAGETAQRHHEAGLWRLLNDLGVSRTADLGTRAAALPGFLPQVWTVAEDIMNATPAIHDQHPR